MSMKRKHYEKRLHTLQVELSKLQAWFRVSGERAIVVFEGRDAAGKGGMIRSITERLSKRVFRTVALPKPSDRETSQWYPQRYVQHFPSAGEITVFDRSWYNRACVERVMGFSSMEQVEHFYRECPNFERAIVNSGIKLIKYWLEVDQDVQLQRFRDRIDDPRKHWKLSPMDMESRRKWYEYSLARDEMFKHTDTVFAPWYIVGSNDQRGARLNCIAHLLSQFPYWDVPFEIPDMPEVDTTHAYEDKASIKERRWVPEKHKGEAW